MEYLEVKLQKAGGSNVIVVEDRHLINLKRYREKMKETDLVQVRSGGEFKDKAFYLDDFEYDWILGQDQHGCLLLIPVMKE